MIEGARRDRSIVALTALTAGAAVPVALWASALLGMGLWSALRGTAPEPPHRVAERWLRRVAARRVRLSGALRGDAGGLRSRARTRQAMRLTVSVSGV